MGLTVTTAEIKQDFTVLLLDFLNRQLCPKIQINNRPFKGIFKRSCVIIDCVVPSFHGLTLVRQDACTPGIGKVLLNVLCVFFLPRRTGQQLVRGSRKREAGSMLAGEAGRHHTDCWEEAS